MPQEIIARFTATMTGVVLLGCLILVVVLGLTAWRLPGHRRRALLGVVLMALVNLTTGVAWLLLPQKTQGGSRLFLPLVAPLLLLSLYRLTFPPQVPGAHRATRPLLLLLLTGGACLAISGLVLLDLLFS